jgi:hypothetical protein
VVTAPRRRNAKRAKRGWLCLGRPRRRKPRGLAPRASRSTCPCARHEAARPRASSAARACLNSTGAAGACSARCRHAALAAIRADRATRLTAGTASTPSMSTPREQSPAERKNISALRPAVRRACRTYLGAVAKNASHRAAASGRGLNPIAAAVAATMQRCLGSGSFTPTLHAPRLISSGTLPTAARSWSRPWFE